MGSAIAKRRIFPWRLRGTIARLRQKSAGRRAATSAGTSANAGSSASKRMLSAIAATMRCSSANPRVARALVNGIPLFSWVSRARERPVASMIPARTRRSPIAVSFTIPAIRWLFKVMTPTCSRGEPLQPEEEQLHAVGQLERHRQRLTAGQSTICGEAKCHLKPTRFNAGHKGHSETLGVI